MTPYSSMKVLVHHLPSYQKSIHIKSRSIQNEVSEDINIGDPEADLRLYFPGETG